MFRHSPAFMNNRTNKADSFAAITLYQGHRLGEICVITD